MTSAALKPLPTILLLAVLLLLANLLTFRGTLANTFIPLDDPTEITDNPHIQHLDADALRWMFTDTAVTQRYIPLSWLTWATVFHFFGLHAAPYHALALIVHTLNPLLLFLLLMQLLQRCIPQPPGSRTIPLLAALSAALWALHPLRVEAVAWATQVRFAEATLFALLSLLAYLRIPATPRTAWRSLPFWLSVAAYAASVLYYPNAIMLAPVLLLLDIVLLGRLPANQPRLPALARLTVEKFPFFLLAAFVGAMTLFGRFFTSAHYLPPETLQSFPLLNRLMQAAFVFLYFLAKSLDPFHNSPIYTMLIDFNPLALPFLFSLCTVIAFSLATLLFRKRFPALFAFWWAYLLIVLPVGGYLERGYVPSDRYTYFPSLVLAAALPLLLLQLWPRLTTPLRSAIVIVLLATTGLLAALSHAAIPMWHDPETLFLAVLEKLSPTDPYRADINWRLANVYREERRFPEAFQRLDQSLAIDPNSMRAIDVQALTFHDFADTLAAPDRQIAFTNAARCYDRLAATFHQVASLGFAGDAYLDAGNLPLAEDRLRRYLSLDPANAPRRYALAFIKFHTHRQTDAERDLQQLAHDSPTPINPQQILQDWSTPSATAP